jgi:hypothetical protein
LGFGSAWEGWRHYRLFDAWMKEEAVIVQLSHYDNHDKDAVAQEEAVRRIASFARQL